MQTFLKKTVFGLLLAGIFLSPYSTLLINTDGVINISDTRKVVSAQGEGTAPSSNSSGDDVSVASVSDEDLDTARGTENHDCGWTEWTCYIGKGAIFFLSIAGKAVQLTANTMDAALLFSLSLGHDSQSGVMEGVEAGWETFRDLANLVFIFALLYIAIATILQLTSFDTKKTLGLLIVVGLLINFSLFATKIVVDTSNVLGCFFYEEVTAVGGGGTAITCADAANITNANFWNNKGIGAVFADQMKITSFYNIPPGADAGDYFSGANLAVIGFFGTIFLLILAFVFLMGAVLFIMRSVALLFLMALSPLAFIGFALPYTSNSAKNWWNKLISYSFLAPIFLVLIFVVMQVMIGVAAAIGVEGPTGFDESFANALSREGVGSIGVIFNFLLIIGLTIAAIIVSKSFGDNLGSASVNIAQRTARFAGKNTFGVTGSAMRKFGEFQQKAGMGGRASRSLGSFLESRSYDVGRAPGADKAGVSQLGDSKNVAQQVGGVIEKMKYGGEKMYEDFKATKGQEAKDSFFKGLSENGQEELYKQMSASERAELLAKDESMNKRIEELDAKLPAEDQEKTVELRGKKRSADIRRIIKEASREAGESGDFEAALKKHASNQSAGANLDEIMKDFIGKMTTDDVAKVDSRAMTAPVMKEMSKKQFRKYAMEGNVNNDTIETMRKVYSDIDSSHPVKVEIDNGGLDIYKKVKGEGEQQDQGGGSGKQPKGSSVSASTNIGAAREARDQQQGNTNNQ